MKVVAARLAQARSCAQSAVAANVPDILMASGACGVAYGAWLIYEPAGFIVGGLLLLAAGVLASRGGD